MLLTVKQAADRLQVKPWAVYDLIRRRELPAIRVTPRLLRIRETDLVDWVARQARLQTTAAAPGAIPSPPVTYF